MRAVTVSAIALASVGSAVYFMPGETNGHKAADQLAAVTMIATNRTPLPTTNPEPPAAASSKTTAPAQPRVFSPDRPLTGQALLAPVVPPGVPKEKVASVITPPPVTSFIAPVTTKPADIGQRKLSSSRPADEDARRELVRDLQRELKRVGCFDGEVNGTWNPLTKKAMIAFTDRVNATLPLDEPDYILLTLVQGHGSQACGKSCPAGQAYNEDGRCLPRAIVAQKIKRSTDKTASAALDSQSNPVVASVAKPLPTPKIASAWSTVVTATPTAPETTTRPVPSLPGRMAMGAPVDAPTALAPVIDTTKSDIARRKADLIEAERNSTADTERQMRQADAQARRANETAKLKKSQIAQLDSAASGIAAVAPVTPSLTKPQISEKRAKETEAPNFARAPLPPGYTVSQAPIYRAPAPRFLPPPYTVGRLAVAAPRPSYAAEPRRWTRSIFSDVTRMR